VATTSRIASSEQRYRAHPEFGPQQVAHVERTRAQQPQRAPLETHRGEHEAPRDRRQHEARHGQVEERNQLPQQRRHPFAGERQIADVGHVHHEQHEQQNQLAPLRGVAREDLELLEHQLTPVGRQPGEHAVNERTCVD
jgi:hypothetical protein